MDINEILAYLGRASSDQELANVFFGVGVDLALELRLPSGEYRAYIERPELGVSFVFTDEAVFLGENNQSVGVGGLYFTGIFLYADGKEQYAQFSGHIPKGLSFTVDRDGVIKNLGEPSWCRKRSDGSVAADRWDSIANYRLHITYSTETNTPALISISLPDKN